MQELHTQNANIQIQSQVEHDPPARPTFLYTQHPPSHTHTNYSTVSVSVGLNEEVALMNG